MTVVDISLSSDEKLIPADWQREDIARLIEADRSANWSDMGCYKTSSALWMTDYVMKQKEIEHPAILVITTRSGKGAFFRDIPKTTEGYTVFNVDNTKVKIVLPGGKQIKIQKELADEIEMPHIVVTHYHVFQKCNLGKTEVCQRCDGTTQDPLIGLDKTCIECDGRGSLPMPLTQGDRIIKRNWDQVIVDEAHRMKNKDTKWTENIKRIKCPRKHIMTGTGFINRPDEIWSLLNFLDNDTFSAYWRFRNHFCEIDASSGWEVVRGCLPEHKAEFRALVRDYGPRRDKLEVFPNLPVPIYEDIVVELNQTQLRMYNELKQELYTLDQMGIPLTSPNVLSLLNRLRQVCVATPKVTAESFDVKTGKRMTHVELVEPSSKLDAVEEVIEGLRWDDDDRQQIVVFSNFSDPLKLLAQRLDPKYDKNGKLKDKGTPYIWMQASDNDDIRMEKWLNTWPKKEHQVFMSTVALGGESIDLTSAEYICFLDQSWSPKDNNQARDRVWRPGQTKTAVVIRLFAEDTVDYYVLGKLVEKQGWFNEIFGKEIT